MRAASVFAGLVAVASAASLASKGCVNKCWEYTKYVSSCTEAEGIQCLCDDSEYQNAVYQCLYSQCPSAHFSKSLHETLAKCSAPGVEDNHAFIRQNDLRIKRDAPAYAPPAYGAPAYTPPAYTTPVVTASVTRSAPPAYGSPTRAAPPVYGSVSASGSAYSRTYTARGSGSPYVSGSVAPTATSTRAGGVGGGVGATPKPTPSGPLKGAAAAAPAGMGLLAAAGMALAVLA